MWSEIRKGWGWENAGQVFQLNRRRERRRRRKAIMTGGTEAVKECITTHQGLGCHIRTRQIYHHSQWFHHNGWTQRYTSRPCKSTATIDRLRREKVQDSCTRPHQWRVNRTRNTEQAKPVMDIHTQSESINHTTRGVGSKPSKYKVCISERYFCFPTTTFMLDANSCR